MQAPPLLAADAALFLDFDGTLVAIAETPEAVVVPDGLVPTLIELHELLGGALAVVSGRQIDSIDRFLAPLRLPAAGEHGVQRRDAEGHMTELSPPDLGFVLDACNELAGAHAGLLVERKHAAIALHYRLAPTLEDLCRNAIAVLVANHPQLEVLHGKCVVEVKPAGMNKGIAIDAFMKEPPFRGRAAVFAGDDTTDETGFAVVQRMEAGVAIKVGSGPSQALHRLADTTAVHAWLTAVRDALAAGKPAPARARRSSRSKPASPERSAPR